MKLTEIYISEVVKRLPKSHREAVAKELQERVEKLIDERGGYSEGVEREVLTSLGSPRLLAEEYSERHYLIGPELYGTYITVLKIVIAVAVAGTFIGNTVEFAYGGKSVLSYLGAVVFTALSAATGAFGWITLVFAILERKAKEEILEEIHSDWSVDELPKEDVSERKFSEIGVIVEVCVIAIVAVFVNNYLDLVAVYYGEGGTMNSIGVLDLDAFGRYIPYINAVLALQLIFAGSKLIARKWTYPVAAGNAVVNLISFVLVMYIFGSTDILNPELLSGIKNISPDIPEIGKASVENFFRGLRIVFALAFTLDTVEGFYNAYKNSEKEN